MIWSFRSRDELFDIPSHKSAISPRCDAIWFDDAFVRPTPQSIRMNMKDPRHFGDCQHTICFLINCHILTYPPLPTLSLRYLTLLNDEITQMYQKLQSIVMAGKLKLFKFLGVGSLSGLVHAEKTCNRDFLVHWGWDPVAVQESIVRARSTNLQSYSKVTITQIVTLTWFR